MSIVHFIRMVAWQIAIPQKLPAVRRTQPITKADISSTTRGHSYDGYMVNITTQKLLAVRRSQLIIQVKISSTSHVHLVLQFYGKQPQNPFILIVTGNFSSIFAELQILEKEMKKSARFQDKRGFSEYSQSAATNYLLYMGLNIQEHSYR